LRKRRHRHVERLADLQDARGVVVEADVRGEIDLVAGDVARVGDAEGFDDGSEPHVDRAAAVAILGVGDRVTALLVLPQPAAA
jgi:hypothetical protein